MNTTPIVAFFKYRPSPGTGRGAKLMGDWKAKVKHGVREEVPKGGEGVNLASLRARTRARYDAFCMEGEMWNRCVYWSPKTIQI